MWIFILVGFFLRIFMYLFGCTGSCITRGLLLWSTDSLVVAQGLSCSTAFFVAAVQSLSHIWCFATPWTAAHQASLSFTLSLSLLKLTSTESVMLSNHLILCRSLLLLPSVFPRSWEKIKQASRTVVLKSSRSENHPGSFPSWLGFWFNWSWVGPRHRKLWKAP